ncbi:MAG: VWA domain-containing protein [Kofleriaceae bacterium]|nr:VWA domain-containing protein [Kofleriaceae bacterium]MCB9571756.1 VWA domain-containing protein [Kofleriaceae bacterium]
MTAVLATACGSNPGNGGDDDNPSGDADGDTISDQDEGAPDVDTDGDGTPDWQDDDSDGDGIPDYREAGDTDVTTAPNDSDGDGVPDFQDTDSDDNGRPDGVDGLDDTDSDGQPDFADLDDDGDFINDVVEIGTNPDSPRDTDNDGIPDFRDTDSDGDTILDIVETVVDYDDDGIPNYLDLDSDADCIPDAMETDGGNPPPDTDGDNRYDFVDRDSDDDGIPDGTEDANCNGVQDPGETSATSQDSDGDGVSDLVETAAGTDPLDSADNPQNNGDFVFVVPYEDSPSPMDDDLDFATDLVSVDVYVLVDRSGSMSTEINSVRSNLATAITHLQCPPIGTGDPADCISDLWAGAGTIGYSGSGADTYKNHADIQPSPNVSTLPTTEPSGCCAEAEEFSAWAALTGNGTSQATGCGLSGVNARATCAGSPANNAGYTGWGYPCFRNGALPVILLATDEAPLSGGDTNHCPAWNPTVRDAFNNRSAKLIGITGSGFGADLTTDFTTMTTDTGSVDAANGNAPLIFDGAGTNAATAIENGIRTLANGVPLDLSAPITDDPGDTVDAVVSFVDHLETLQLGTAQCSNGLTDIDTNADAYRDAYVDVRAGTPVCWKLIPKMNTTVPATNVPQLYRATITVYGDSVTVLDTRDVFFLVPPGAFDPPVN